MNHSSTHRRILAVSRAGVIAALYTVLTVVMGPLGSSAVQCRVSEALCVLPIFYPEAIAGVTAGCLVSNLLTGGAIPDVIFGTLATLIGAAGAFLLRKFPYLAPLPTVAANTLILPPVLAYAYGAEQGIAFLALTIGLGELISAYGLGILLYWGMKKSEGKFFRS